MYQLFRIILVLVMLAVQLRAHDYWLEADKARLAIGDTAVVRLMFGKNFAEGIEKPLQLERTSEYRLYGQTRRYENLLSSATDPIWKLEKPGTMLVTMERSASEISFGRAKFLQYASEEGNVISEQDLPATKNRVRETYTRYLKTLLQVGPETNKTASKITGQKYEIIPLTNPYAVGATDLKLKILFDGKPASGVKVTALQKENGKLTTASAITNQKGKCALPITQAGHWLVRSVKIIPDAPNEGPEAGYHSYWASLTFGYE